MSGAVGALDAVAQARRIELDEPWAWLAAGWRDLIRIPFLSLAYGAGFAAASAGLTIGLFLLDLSYLLLPLAAGVMLVGPLLAVGLYEASRRLEAGEPVTLASMLFVATRSPAQLAFVGVLLALTLLAWVRVATLLFALFFATSGWPPFDDLVALLLFTGSGLGLLVVGTVVGGVIALVVFAMSAFAVPMLMAREVDAVTAILTSVRAVRDNFWAMLVWAWLIALLMAFGMATLYVGLVVTFPLVGHATWHAYRRVIGGA